MLHTIEFYCWDKDIPTEVQLEPEAELFEILPGQKLRFIADSNTGHFVWAMRLSRDDNSNFVQLFPEDKGIDYKIKFYKNDELVDDY